MAESKNMPSLRFPEFEGEWVTGRLGDILDITSAARVHKDEWSEEGVPFFRSSDVVAAFKGTENTKAYIPHDLYDSLSGKIGRVKKNDLLVTGGGSVGIPYLVKNNDPLYFKDADLLWIKNKNSTDGYFLYSFFLTPIFKKYLNEISHIGTIAHYTVVQARNTPVSLPTLLEQQKIASFLTSVDTKIEQLTKKKTLLEQYKKGVMQKIFSQEIRFKKEDGSEYPDWEEKALGELLDYEQPTEYLVKNTEYDDSYDTPVLTAGKTFLLGYTNEKDGIFSHDLPVIIFDDFTTASQFVTFPFKAKSSAMKILKPKGGVNIKFVFEAIQMIEFEVGGHGRHWISQYSIFSILVPCNEEQLQIDNFLSAIDDKIKLVNTQLEKTLEFKKGLLQQMFV